MNRRLFLGPEKITRLALMVAMMLALWSVAHAEDKVSSGNASIIMSTEVVRTTTAKGEVVEKRIVKKLRARTVVDFEEASIEGKLKKPNAAYLLHGADFEFKHLYRIRDSQRSRILSSYEYLR